MAHIPGVGWRLRLCGLVATALLLTSGIRAQRQNPQSPRFQRLQQWLTALAEHVPGTTDETLRSFASWTVSDWQLLADDAQALVLLSKKPELTTFWLPRAGASRPAMVTYTRANREYLVRLSCLLNDAQASLLCNAGPHPTGSLLTLQQRIANATARGDRNYLLHLASLLHTDLAQWGGTRDAAPSNAIGQLGGVFLDVTDGRASGLRQYGIQWVIAYWLLDRALFTGDDAPTQGTVTLGGTQVVQPDNRDEWVRDWYVAVGFWMQRTAHYDEAHLNRGLQFFPGDAELHFLSGCQHEIDASPELQNAIKSTRLPFGTGLTIASPEVELRAAATDYNQALGGRPGWTEARIRLGRVLLEVGQLSEAEKELRIALTSTADPSMRYLGSLFLGAIAERSKRWPEARALYEQATALFPTAQSPRLALSQLARRDGNRREAVRALQDLFDRDRQLGGTESRSDPWVDYLSIQTLHSEARLAALGEPFRKEQSR